MPLRSVKMNRFIFGFQRRVWCPKWTPLSSSCFMLTTAMPCSLSVVRAARGPCSSVVAGPGGDRPGVLQHHTPEAVARRDRGGDCPAVRREGERAKSTRPRRIARAAYLVRSGPFRGRSDRPQTTPGGADGAGRLRTVDSVRARLLLTAV